jgi:hypothetical protein
MASSTEEADMVPRGVALECNIFCVSPSILLSISVDDEEKYLNFSILSPPGCNIAILEDRACEQEGHGRSRTLMKYRTRLVVG